MVRPNPVRVLLAESFAADLLLKDRVKNTAWHEQVRFNERTGNAKSNLHDISARAQARLNRRYEIARAHGVV